MTVFTRVLITLDRVVEWLLALILALLVVIGGGQVLLRFVFHSPLSWALESSVILLVWATMLSGYVGVRRDCHLSADFLGLRMGPAARWWLQVASLVLCLVFVAVYGWTSIVVIDAIEGIPFTSLPITQPVLYWSLPISAVLMGIALLDRLRLRFAQRPAAA